LGKSNAQIIYLYFNDINRVFSKSKKALLISKQ